jgi:hypothetical protein
MDIYTATEEAYKKGYADGMRNAVAHGDKVQVIKIGRTARRWLKLMLHFQNAVPGAFHLPFPDRATAHKVAHRMTNAMEDRSEWFNMLVIQRENNVYVIKPQHMQKVVIRDE